VQYVLSDGGQSAWVAEVGGQCGLAAIALANKLARMRQAANATGFLYRSPLTIMAQAST
jgi:hypothetical protein